MAHQPFSRPTLIVHTPDTLSRRSSDPVYGVKRNNHANNDIPSGTCCSGGGHHGCGCGCKSCMCRLTDFKDVSNREAYGGEGGRQGMPGPDVDFPDRASRLDSSWSSPHTDILSNASLDNSIGASGHFGGHPAASIYINGMGHQFAPLEEEDDDHHPWPDFISPANSLDHISFDQDSSGMVIPGLFDDSALAARGSGTGIAIDERSMLSSEYESSFPSATASQVLTGVGTAFGNHFLVRPLPLTPECRHSVDKPIRTGYIH